MNCSTCGKPLLTPTFCWTCGRALSDGGRGALEVTAVPLASRRPLIDLLRSVSVEPRPAVEATVRDVPFRLASSSPSHLVTLEHLLAKLRVQTRQVAPEPAGWTFRLGRRDVLFLAVKVLVLAAVAVAAQRLGLGTLMGLAVAMVPVAFAFALEPRPRALELAPELAEVRLSALEQQTIDALVRLRGSLSDAELIAATGAFIDEFSRHSALVREEETLSGTRLQSGAEALVTSVMSLATELQATADAELEARKIAPHRVAEFRARKALTLNQLAQLTQVLVEGRAAALGLPREPQLAAILQAVGRARDAAHRALVEVGVRAPA